MDIEQRITVRGLGAVLVAVTLALAGCGGGSDGGGGFAGAGLGSGAAGQTDTSANALADSRPPPLEADRPFFDPVAYGNGPDDSVSVASEDSAITHHDTVIDGKRIRYTATAGHLVTYDPLHSTPSAKMFYVAYTADGKDARTRPVTFFYNGGPGSASVWLLLGSYAPKRIKTSLPDFTPPAPYTVETNPDSLLDRSDLVFINPVATGYSAAIAPNKNKDFWGVDKDAKSINQFIKRYLTANGRWNSPKYLFGESYGTPRSAVMSYLLHMDGIDLNGIVLLSSILDYSQNENPVGLLPTYAADAWYHKKATYTPLPADLPAYMALLTKFASGDFAKAVAPEVARKKKISDLRDDPELEAAINGAFEAAGSPSSLAWSVIVDYINTLPNSASVLPKFKAYYKAVNDVDYDPEIEAAIRHVIDTVPNPTYQDVFDYLATLPNAADLTARLNKRLQDQADAEAARPEPSDAIVTATSKFIGISKPLVKGSYLAVGTDDFQRNLVPGVSVGAYDGRATTTNLGVASQISLINNDAFDRAVNGVYIAAWNFYINQELKYTSNSAFTGISNVSWDYTHKDPTDKTTKTRGQLNTLPDLAATMSVNPDVKVLQLSGYYDNVTPWYQTRIDLEQNLPLDPKLRKNLEINEYPSGHQIYLDGPSRTKAKSDLVRFYEASTSDDAANARILKLQQKTLLEKSLLQ